MSPNHCYQASGQTTPASLRPTLPLPHPPAPAQARYDERSTKLLKHSNLTQCWCVQELQERKKIKKKERKKKKKPESEAEADADTAPAETSEAEPGEHEESSDEAAQPAFSPKANPQDVAQLQKETAEAAAAAAADGEVPSCCLEVEVLQPLLLLAGKVSRWAHSWDVNGGLAASNCKHKWWYCY